MRMTSTKSLRSPLQKTSSQDSEETAAGEESEETEDAVENEDEE